VHVASSLATRLDIVSLRRIATRGVKAQMKREARQKLNRKCLTLNVYHRGLRTRDIAAIEQSGIPRRDVSRCSAKSSWACAEESVR
jgi:hypothetical protein